MDRDTEKSMEEKVRKNPPIYKRKLFIAGSIVIAVLIGAVISSIIFGKLDRVFHLNFLNGNLKSLNRLSSHPTNVRRKAKITDFHISGGG